jgi:serine/threonine protein kinase
VAETGQGTILRERYELREELGAGTSGAVHRAFDRTLGREVAIKLLHEVPRGDALRRFEREAKIAAQLRHPDMIHPAPTAGVISAAIRLGAGGVARWPGSGPGSSPGSGPGSSSSLVQQIRKAWRRLPKP